MKISHTDHIHFSHITAGDKHIVATGDATKSEWDYFRKQIASQVHES